MLKINFAKIEKRIQISELFELNKNGEYMGAKLIDEVAVETAVLAAKESLISDLDVKWIRKSSLLERAYYLGLYKGLISISDSHSLNILLFHALMDTVWERTGDNSFDSTMIGKFFQQMKDDFNVAFTGEKFATKSTMDLISQIHSLDNQWRSCVSHALDLLNQNIKLADEFNRLVESNSLDQDQHHPFLNKLDPIRLEEMLKFISLLETSHEFSKKIESQN